MFAAFIILCGFTHFFEVWTFYDPIYRFSGLLKAITAVISVLTAIMLIPIVPKVLNFTDVFRSILHLAPDGIMVVNAKGEIVMLNDSAHNIFGYENDELQRTKVDKLIPELKECYGQSPQQKQQEFKGIHKNSQKLHLEVSHSRITTAENSVIYTNIIRDISERKQVENTLIEQEQKFRSIFDTLQFACLLDLDGHIIEMNKSGRLLGDFAEEEIANKYFKNLHGLQADVDLCDLNGKDIRSEMKIIKNDREIILDSSLRIISHDGKPLFLLLEARDISNYKKIQNELTKHKSDLEKIVQQRTKKVREDQALLQALLDSIPDIISYKDRKGIYLGCNKAFRDKKYDTQSKKVENTLKELAEEVFHTKQKKQIEQVITLEDGTKRLFQILKVPYSLDDEVLGLVSIHRDITEIKRRENILREAKDAAERANAAQANFLANMSHEIRTPLHGISGFIELLLRSKISYQHYNYVIKMKQLAKTLLGVINDILDFSKIEAGKLSTEKVDFNLMDVLEEMQHQFAKTSQDKNIGFAIDIEKNTPKHLIGDSLRLRQILMNLLSNAFKFTEEGKITLTVNIVEDNQNQALIRFQVKDTGIGIPRKQTDKLFSPFSQVDDSITRKYGGTGLGLSISKKLVELMGGEIFVVSTLGEGSTFTFNLPLGKQRSPAKTSSSRKNRFHGKAVIIANYEEFQSNSQPIKQMTKYFGFDTDIYFDSSEVDRDALYDVIITDVSSTDDIENFLRDKQKIQNLQKTPVILAYDNLSFEDLQKDYDKEKVVYTTKPIEMSALFDAFLSVFGAEIAQQHFNDYTLTTRHIKQLVHINILLVEDNPINQQIACELLSSAEISVSVADNGKKAIEMLGEKEFDLVLMDVQMPIMDGYQATKIIRQESRFQDLPIVAMTAFAMSGDREKCIKAGMNDHLSKPIDPGQLFSTIIKWTEINNPKTFVRSPQNPRHYNIKGVNFIDGLARANNNLALYKKLLLEFIENYKDDVLKIKKVVDSGDFEQAAHITHKIKGVAANLSISNLAQIGGQLEKTLLEKSDCGELWQKFSVLFLQAAHAIEEAFSKDKEEEKEPQAQKKQSLSKEQLDEKLQKLFEVLQKRSPKKCSTIVKDLQQFTLDEMAAEAVAKIKKSIDGYKFKDAKKHLELFITKRGKDGN